MALSSETDAREAVRNILDEDASGGDYSNRGSKPSDIEVVETSPRGQTKSSRRGDAIYVWKPSDSDLGKFGAAGDERRETAVVQVEAWVSATDNTESDCHDLIEDILSIILDKANDSQSSTQFVDFEPIAETDFRHQQYTLQGNHYIQAVQVRCERIA